MSSNMRLVPDSIIYH